MRPFPDIDEDTSPVELLGSIDAFLVVELLGQAFPFRVAGRVLDSFGDAVRGGLKRLRRSEEEQLTSMTVAGHKFFMALRRGAMILATNRETLLEARGMLEQQGLETVPPGFLLRAECDPERFDAFPLIPDELDPDAPSQEELLEEMRELGTVTLELRRVAAGLHLGLRRKGERGLAGWFGERGWGDQDD